MNRRRLLAALLATAALPVHAGPRRWRIFLILGRAEGEAEHHFRTYLAEHGLDAEMVVRETDPLHVAAVVREARARGADLLYVGGSDMLRALTGPADSAADVADLPLVFTSADVPAEVRTQRNLTGVAGGIPFARQLDLMQSYRPFQRIGLIANPADTLGMARLDALRTLAAHRKLILLERHVPQDARGNPIASALPELTAALARQNAELLYLPANAWLTANRRAIVDSALDVKLPTFGTDDLVMRDSQALFGVVSSAVAMGRIAGRQAAAILQRGAPPTSLPIVGVPRPTTLVNLTVASRLGLYPPIALLNRAEILHPVRLG